MHFDTDQLSSFHENLCYMLFSFAVKLMMR